MNVTAIKIGAMAIGVLGVGGGAAAITAAGTGNSGTNAPLQREVRRLGVIASVVGAGGLAAAWHAGVAPPAVLAIGGAAAGAAALGTWLLQRHSAGQPMISDDLSRRLVV